MADAPESQTSNNGPPPSYDGASTNGADEKPPTIEQPPSYESLFGKIKRTRAESSGVVDFLKSFVFIIMSTVCCSLMIGLALVLPISAIVIGSLYLDECPLEKYIPIWLVVFGAFMFIQNCASFLRSINKRKKTAAERREEGRSKMSYFDMCITCFLLAWFIAGNVWVFRSHNDLVTEKYATQVDFGGNITTSDPGDLDVNPNYCQATCFYFAFWFIVGIYILFGLICFCAFCFICLAVCLTKSAGVAAVV